MVAVSSIAGWGFFIGAKFYWLMKEKKMKLTKGKKVVEIYPDLVKFTGRAYYVCSSCRCLKKFNAAVESYFRGKAPMTKEVNEWVAANGKMLIAECQPERRPEW